MGSDKLSPFTKSGLDFSKKLSDPETFRCKLSLLILVYSFCDWLRCLCVLMNLSMFR